MEPKRTLHSGNLVRGICAGDRKLFMEKYYDPEKYMELGTCFVREDGKVFILLKDRWWMGGRKMNQEGQEIFDLKPLTKEEVAWLEEHFIDFAREQYLVRQDDMREALKIAQRQKELQRQDKCGNS